VFLKIIYNYIVGFVNITVEGFFVERFINNCITNKIFLWGIKRKNSTLLTVNINIKNFRNIRTIAQKTKCKIKINSKKGLPIIMHKYRKRKLLVFLFIPIALMILISSNYIWNIEIKGLEKINEDELLHQLSEEGIVVGKSKSNINTKNVINNIRIKRNDISWMSIEMKGTNVIVTVVEAVEKPKIINEEEYCNIVARKNGIITKITADTGTAQVKVGDMVGIGDILIGGYMEGKYTGMRYVHAKGEVEAKVWYIKKIKSEFTREISKETGIEESKYSININNFKINLYKTLPNFENYDTISKTKRIKLFSDFYLPIEIIKTTYIEKEKVEITYGIEQLKEILIKELEEQFSNEGIDKLNVVNKLVNVYVQNSEVEIEMTYEVIENIAAEEKLEE